MKYLWEDLKMLFEVIATIILICLIVFGIFGQIFLGIFGQIVVDIYTNDTNNTNEQIVDYDTYIQNTYNSNFNKNTQTVEEEKDDNDYMTYETVETLPNSDYQPGKMNPFSNK